MAIEPEQVPYEGHLVSDDKNNLRSVTNPTSNDFTFHWGGKAQTIKAGDTKSFPEFIALHGAKHLAEQILFEKNVERFSEPMRDEVITEIVDKKEEVKKEVKTEEVKVVAPKAPITDATVNGNFASR